MVSVPGRFQRVGPTSARRYLDRQTGDVVSRRRFETLRGTPLDRFNDRGPQAEQMVTDYIDSQRRSKGRILSRDDARRDRQLVKHARTVIRLNRARQRRSNKAGRTMPFTTEEARQLVEALEALGRRPRDWTHYVGEGVA